MFSTTAATLPVLIIGLILGVSALSLVANELGKRVGYGCVGCGYQSFDYRRPFAHRRQGSCRGRICNPQSARSLAA